MSRNRNSLRIIAKTALLSVGLLATGMTCRLQAQDEVTIKREFRNPPVEYRPMVRWWWPGGDVSDREIKREIDLLNSQGFGGAEIQPFVTFDTRSLTRDEVARVNDFATPSYFQHVRAAVLAAKAHGMWIDDTFGTGWPFGGGLAITPELSAIELRSADTIVEGPETFSGKVRIPVWQPGLIASMMLHAGVKPDWPAGWEERFEKRSKIVAVVALRSLPGNASTGEKSSSHKPELLDRSSAIVLSDRMQPDGTLDWQVPEGTWHIFVFRQFPTRQAVIGAAGIGPQLVLDHLNRAAFAAHARRVGDPLVAAVGPDAGTSLRAIFCDSLEVQEYLFWTDDFLDQFKKRRGYDLTPYLALLRQPGYNDFYFSHPGGLPMFDMAGVGDPIRADYWKTVAELIDEGFYRPFDVWAEQHKLLSRVQAHGAPGDLLKLYGEAAIPETEELDGGNTVNFMKMASSAGYNYGRKLASSESFVFRGNPYVTTPESIKANADKLFISGINEIVYHGFPYSFNQGLPGIGWFPFQGQFSSQINERNPIWQFIGKVNQYISRVQFIAQRGKSSLQVAILRSALNEDDTGPTPASGPVKDPLPAIEDSLTAAGFSWGFVNEDTLRNSFARNSRLTTKGGGEYDALLIPHESGVSPQLAQALMAFSSAHLPIVFIGGLPAENVSFKNLEHDRASVDAVLDQVSHASSAILCADGDNAAVRLAQVVRPQIQFIAGEMLPFLKKKIGTIDFYLLTNPSSKSSNTTVEFYESAPPQEWDPWTGDIRQIAFTAASGHANIEVTLPPFGSKLIAFGGRLNGPAEATVWEEIKRQEVGNAGWTIDATGDSGNGVGVKVQLNMSKLTDWLNVPELSTFSGNATYATHISISPDDLNASGRILLDLGEVKDSAEVKINGADAGQLVVHPFAVDVRPRLHAGDNEIEIIVVNSLSNYVSTIHLPKNPLNQMGHFPATSSGLLGPVVLEYEAAGDHVRH